jgi:predicted metalloprotease with PDZ domain
LITIPWVLGLVFVVHEWRVDRVIAARQQTTQGVITTHEPSNHNQYGYTFKIKGQAYTGWESPKSTELEIGKVVTVYYDPANPNQNALTDFDELSAKSLGPLPVLC